MSIRPTIPALLAVLLDAEQIGAKLSYQFDPVRLWDFLTIEWEGLSPREVDWDDKALLICRLEKLGFRNISISRLEIVLSCVPHTSEYRAQRESMATGSIAEPVNNDRPDSWAGLWAR